MFKIYHKNDQLSLGVKKQITQILIDNNLIISKTNYKYVITIGGDGTFIESMHSEIEKIRDLVFIPINTGSLGFYTEKFNNFEKILNKLISKEKNINIDCYNLLCAETDNNKYYAINEFTIQSNSKTILYDYFIDGEYLQTLRGSGLLVSTPQGSTAQSKSFNGSVMYPNSKTFQVVELSSINNNKYRTLNSNIILSKDSIFEINISESNFTTFNFDTNYNQTKSEKIKFYLSDQKVKVAHLDKTSFTKRIIDGFIK